MQHYSQSLDLDQLNQRYWYRRMQQCKAEFKSRSPRSPITTSEHHSASTGARAGRDVPESSPSRTTSRSSARMSETPSKPVTVAVTAKDVSSHASSKPARPIKYQVR